MLAALDVPEIKSALKKLKAAAAHTQANASMARAHGAALRVKADKIRKGVKAITLEAEAVATAIKAIRKGTMASRLGEFMFKHGIKPHELAAKWDSSGNGEIDKSEFRERVLGLGLEGSAAEVDGLFESLDGDGGGSLDVAEVKKAFKQLQDQAENKKQTLREKGLAYIAAFAAMKHAQADHRAEQKAEQEATCNQEEAMQSA